MYIHVFQTLNKYTCVNHTLCKLYTCGLICPRSMFSLGSPKHVASSFCKHIHSLLSVNPDTFKALLSSVSVWSAATKASSLTRTEIKTGSW